MAILTYNRVLVSTSTTGTGSVSTGSAVSNAFLSFLTANAGAAIPDGTVVDYELNDGLDFEIGKGTYTAGTLTRDTVYISRIGGTVGTTKITLSGSATVAIVVPKENTPLLTAANDFTGINTFSNTTDASSATAGGLISSGGIAAAKSIWAGKFIRTDENFRTAVAPTSFAQFDTNAMTTISIANGANANIAPNGALYFMIHVAEVSVAGYNALYLCGGGLAGLLVGTPSGSPFVAGTTSPAAGKISLTWDGSNNYKAYNNFGSTIGLKVQVFRA